MGQEQINELVEGFEQWLIDEDDWMGSSRAISGELRRYLETL